jgi:hypothetical protein
VVVVFFIRFFKAIQNQNSIIYSIKYKSQKYIIKVFQSHTKWFLKIIIVIVFFNKNNPAIFLYFFKKIKNTNRKRKSPLQVIS